MALRDFVSVNDFPGADPTGATDSTGAFNAALVRATHVLCPIGTYLITGNVTIPVGSTLEFQNGALLQFMADGMVVLEGTIHAGAWQIFSGDRLPERVAVRPSRYENGNGVYNAKWWGAMGNGIDDDADAIQAAIETAWNATVLFPSGRYIVRRTINAGVVNLIGEGSGRTGSIISPRGFQDDQVVFRYALTNGGRIQHVAIRHLHFEGEFPRGDGQPKREVCFELSHFTDGIIENILSQSMKEVLYIKSNSYSNMFKNISQYDTGGRTVLVLGTGFNNNTFIGCTYGKYGFFLQTDHTADCTEVNDPQLCGGLTFLGCSFESCVRGDGSEGAIHVKTSGNASIAGIVLSGCYFENNANACIYLDGVDLSVDENLRQRGYKYSINGISVTGCMFTGYYDPSHETRFAIVATHAYGIVVTGNHFYKFSHGVIFGNESDGWLVEANSVVATPALTTTSNVLGGAGGYLKNNSVGRTEAQSFPRPITGSAVEGDIAWNLHPRSADYIGWVCTEGGSPGIWRGFGRIE
jgi:hypothetical protein